MQINSAIQAIAGTYSVVNSASARRAYSPGAQAQPERGDKLHISKEAQSFSSMLRELKGMDDVREDKVAAYQEAIADGTYNVSSRDVAAKILGLDL